jgi:hypothetical protein
MAKTDKRNPKINVVMGTKRPGSIITIKQREIKDKEYEDKSDSREIRKSNKKKKDLKLSKIGIVEKSLQIKTREDYIKEREKEKKE